MFLWGCYFLKEIEKIGVTKMTVKALLEKYPNAEFDFMSPGGYVYLTAEKARALLAGEPAFAHAGFPDTGISIPAEMLLTQEICFGGLEWQCVLRPYRPGTVARHGGTGKGV